MPKPQIVEKKGIKGKRPGRKDYSEAVAKQATPMVRSFQTRVSQPNEWNVDVPADEFLMITNSLKEPIQSFFDVYVDVGSTELMEIFFGVVNMYPFQDTAQTISDLEYYTVHGPFYRHYAYGHSHIPFTAPVTFKPKDDRYWNYTVIRPVADATVHVDLEFVAYSQVDKYGK